MIEPKAICKLCGSTENRTAQRAEPPYRVLRCTRCGLTFVHPQPEHAAESYGEDYYRPWLDDQLEARRELWRRRLIEVERAHPPRGRLLDVGCGIPHFIEQARADGWDVAGTEVSGFACAFAKDNMGLEIFHGTLEQARFDPESFDVVTLWHVLEHMPDPVEALLESHRILKPGGLLVVAVPNLDNYFIQAAYLLARGRQEKLFSINDRELHLFHFSEKTLRGAVEKAEFTTLRVCPDLGEIDPRKKIIDTLPAALFGLTGLNLTSALRLYARRGMTEAQP